MYRRGHVRLDNFMPSCSIPAHSEVEMKRGG